MLYYVITDLWNDNPIDNHIKLFITIYFTIGKQHVFFWVPSESKSHKISILAPKGQTTSSHTWRLRREAHLPCAWRPSAKKTGSLRTVYL